MSVVAFAVTDADGPTIDTEFYGFEPQLITCGPIATVVISSGEPPAAIDETLLAYHRFVEAVADARACLPHRFGLVVDESAVEDEMDRNKDVYRDALEATRNRCEWLLRATAIPEPAAIEAMTQAGQRPQGGSALETGERVHRLVTAHLADRAPRLAESLGADNHVFIRGHKNGLGFDLEIVSGAADAEFPGFVEERCDSLAHYLEFELFGPTPCYRYSDRIMRELR